MGALYRRFEDCMGICGGWRFFKQLAISVEDGAELCVAPMGAKA
jgi:hypothetical protein